MSQQNAQAVQIGSALAIHDESGMTLSMMTVEGVEVRFLLDDFAVAMLALTFGPIVHTIADRNREGIKPRIFPKQRVEPDIENL